MAQMPLRQAERRGSLATAETFQYIYIQCKAPKIAKLVYNCNNYGLWYL